MFCPPAPKMTTATALPEHRRFPHSTKTAAPHDDFRDMGATTGKSPVTAKLTPPRFAGQEKWPFQAPRGCCLMAIGTAGQGSFPSPCRAAMAAFCSPFCLFKWQFRASPLFQCVRSEAPSGASSPLLGEGARSVADDVLDPRLNKINVTSTTESSRIRPLPAIVIRLICQSGRRCRDVTR